MPKPGMRPNLMADGDLGSPADMDTPSPEEDPTAGKATLDSISGKLDKIMMALGIPDDDDEDPNAGPPGDMPGGANPEMMPS
jgi:hypothetical protein